MRYQISSLDLLKQLLNDVPLSDACMEWPRQRDPKGYGKLGGRASSTLVHRNAYVLTMGPIPDGLSVCHRCDNPSCFRPSHLFLGTNLDNIRDCMLKKRRANRQGTNHGMAKLTEAQVREIRRLRAGGMSIYRLGSIYNVTGKCVSLIASRKLWSHI